MTPERKDLVRRWEALAPGDPLYATPRDSRRATYGPDLRRVAAGLGRPFMPWQTRVGDVVGEIEAGRPWYRGGVITVPRQCGKSLFGACLCLVRLILWPTLPQIVIWQAQTIQDAIRVWQRGIWPLIEASGLAEAEGLSPRWGIAKPGIDFANGSALEIVSSSTKSGHGATAGLIIRDESWAITDPAQVGAKAPTQRTILDAQAFDLSTMGDDTSLWLNDQVDAGRERVRKRVKSRTAFFEYGAGDHDSQASIKHTDPKVWAKAIPALGRSQPEEAILHDLESLSEREFRRTALNQRVPGMGSLVIPAELWERVQTSSLNPLENSGGDTPILPLGQVVSVYSHGGDTGWTSISVADRRGVVKLADYLERPAEAELPLARLLARLLVPNEGPTDIVVIADSPMDDLVTRLTVKWAKMFPLGRVVRVKGGEYTRACTRFFDEVTRGRVRVVANPTLTASLGRAWRKEFTMGGFQWRRHDKTCDISPLVTVTLAFDRAVRMGETPPPEPGTVEVADLPPDEEGNEHPLVEFYQELWSPG